MKTNVTDEIVEQAWAAIVGRDIAKSCYGAYIIRADLRAGLEAVWPAVADEACGQPRLEDAATQDFAFNP